MDDSTVIHPPAGHVWTVAEAKTRLSEVLRRAEQEGPQRIGVRKSFVVMPAELWNAKSKPAEPMGRWLVENMPRGANLKAPDRREPARLIPFIDDPW
ncbi:MAG: type II toxin-antitoxin system prevent-host-death family antitoxin [bacterium]|nr:type II toxin-antitoxin system prevent-host-death family antitoxin [bacterium]